MGLLGKQREIADLDGLSQYRVRCDLFEAPTIPSFSVNQFTKYPYSHCAIATDKLFNKSGPTAATGSFPVMETDKHDQESFFLDFFLLCCEH